MSGLTLGGVNEMGNFWADRQEAQRRERLERDALYMGRRAKQLRLLAKADELKAQAGILWAEAAELEALKYFLQIENGGPDRLEELIRLDAAESAKRAEGWPLWRQARDLEAEAKALQESE